MTAFMPYIYSAMWFIIAIALFYISRKNNYGFSPIVGGAMFIFMGAWWLIDALLPTYDLMSGTYGWIFRIIILVFVIFMIIFYLQYKRDNKR
jgi:hypothetical protein